jgi:SNF2 family DNA or RNA helicase
MYESYKTELRSTVVQDGVAIEDDADAILKRLLRLVQVASNPKMIDESYHREPGKVPRLLELVYQAIDAGEKIIVWTTFVQNSLCLGELLSEFGSVVINGAVNIDERNKRLARFKSEPECKILVATPGAAKEGLTLTVANRAVFFDRSFSLDDYLQAQDRIHRISQSKQCYIYNLVARDTVDEWVDALIDAKSAAAKLAQGDISEEQYRAVQSYDFGESIRKVLGIDEPMGEFRDAE